MILLTIQEGDQGRLGVRTARGVIDVAAAQADLGAGSSPAPETVDALITGGEKALTALADLVRRAEAAPATGTWLHDEQAVSFGPAVPNPGKIVCVGLNYLKHAE